MTRLDAIKEGTIKHMDAMLDQYLDGLMSSLPQDDELGWALRNEAPFDPQEKLLGELTGEKLLAAFSMALGLIASITRDYVHQGVPERDILNIAIKEMQKPPDASDMPFGLVPDDYLDPSQSC
jgi:hypothetical protein